MDITGRAVSVVLRLATAMGLGLAVLAVILAGIGFLAAGVFIHFDQILGPARAAAATGGGLIALAILIGLAGGWSLKKFKRRRSSLLAEFSATYGLGARLISLLIRKDPKKSILMAALAGAVIEFLMGDNKK